MDIIHELLIKEKDSLLKKLVKVNKALEQFQSSEEGSTLSAIPSVTDNKNLSKKFKNSTDAERLLNVLKENQRFMKIREMGEFIHSIIGGDLDNWIVKLSRKTKSLREKDKIIKIQIGAEKRNTFWGSPTWINDKGNVKDEYMYNENLIKKRAQVDLFEI
jgi:hypothetical protein